MQATLNDLRPRLGRAGWRRTVAGLLVLLCHAADVNSAPPDPALNFLRNFLAPAYYMPIYPLDVRALGGDLTAVYDQAYIRNSPNLELLLIGEFPRARFFSITVYDDHGATIDTIHDAELVPLRPDQANPYRKGGPAGLEDVLYAVRIRLGEGFIESPVAGCGMQGMDATSNVLDARWRHTAGTRYSAAESHFSVTARDGIGTIVHDDSASNAGTFIVVRRYLEENDANKGAFDLTRPLVFVRTTATGCAANMWELVGRPQPDPSAALPASAWYAYGNTMTATQVDAHLLHAAAKPLTAPEGLDPGNRLAWYAGPEYVLATNSHTGYLGAAVSDAGQPAMLNARGQVMRMRFRLPTMPCQARVCPLTGGEDLRYWGLSLVNAARTVVASLSDLDLHPDVNGYVTLILSFGTSLPAQVQASNGYSVVRLPPTTLRQFTLRNILPSAAFRCAIGKVPFSSSEHTAAGGYMGEYVPFVDFPLASTLPASAAPYVQAGSCPVGG